MPPREAIHETTRQIKNTHSHLWYLKQVEWVLVDSNGAQPPVFSTVIWPGASHWLLKEPSPVLGRLITRLHFASIRARVGGNEDSELAMSSPDGELVNVSTVAEWQLAMGRLAVKRDEFGLKAVSPIRFGLRHHISRAADRTISIEPESAADTEMVDADRATSPFFREDSLVASSVTEPDVELYPLDFDADRPLAADLLPHWGDACRFFCHDPRGLRGVRLPGFSCRLPQPTMLAIYCWLSLRRQRYTTCPDVELTVPECMAAVGILALAWAATDACLFKRRGASTCSATNPDSQHLTDVEKLYGLQCPCQENSLTRAITQSTSPGSCVAFAQNDAHARGLVRLAEVLFTTVQDSTSPLVTSATFSGSTYVPPTGGSGYTNLFIPKPTADVLLGTPTSPSLSWIMSLAEARAKFECMRVQSSATNKKSPINKSQLILVINVDGLDVQALDHEFSATLQPETQEGSAELGQNDPVIITRLLKPMFIFTTGGSEAYSSSVNELLSDLWDFSDLVP